jgi:hypothetical protein
VHEQAEEQPARSGWELPVQVAEQAPMSQFTSVPSQASGLVPQSIEQGPAPQLRSRSPQPS